MPTGLTLTLKPHHRSLRLIEKRQQARHTPYRARKTSGSQPAPAPEPRATSPVVKEEVRASSPIIKQEPQSTTPSTRRDSGPAPPAVPTKRAYNPSDSHHDWSSKPQDHPQWEAPLDLYSIPQYYAPIGPNKGGDIVDPRCISGNFVIDEMGVERRVLGKGEVASLTTLECWENWDLF